MKFITEIKVTFLLCEKLNGAESVSDISLFIIHVFKLPWRFFTLHFWALGKPNHTIKFVNYFLFSISDLLCVQ